MTFHTSCATLGRSFEALMGNAEFSEFDSLSNIIPPPSFDSLIMDYLSLKGVSPSDVIPSPWTDRILDTTNYFHSSSAGSGAKPKTPKRKYKPVHLKVRPVPTYFPDPQAQQFKEIPSPTPTPLPHHPKDWRQLPFNNRITRERLETMLAVNKYINKHKNPTETQVNHLEPKKRVHHNVPQPRSYCCFLRFELLGKYSPEPSPDSSEASCTGARKALLEPAEAAERARGPGPAPIRMELFVVPPEPVDRPAAEPI